jgi:hypothetical protein
MSHPSDEILSALLDDDAVDGVDAAHVAGCVACQGRLGALREVATALAEPITAPAHLREASVAAALVETSGASGAVRRLAMARRARAQAAASSARRMSAASAAAALLVALGVGGWLLDQSRGTADNHTTGANLVAGAANPRTESATGLRATTTAVVTFGQLTSGARSGADSSSAIFDAGQIGEYSDLAPIIARYHDYVADPSPPGGSYMVTLPCPKPDDRAVVWHATLTYNGTPAYARVLMASQSDQILEIRAQADCALVESQAI